MLLEGIHIPLTTPFFAGGRLNLRKLEQNVARYSVTPAAGLLVLGPTGEANLLTDDERLEILRTAIAAASPTKVMLAGVSSDGVSCTLVRIQAAAAFGYDAVLLAAPEFGGASAQEQRIYLRSVADRSALPILLRGTVEEELLCELAAHPGVIGAVRDFSSAEEVARLLRRTAGVTRTVTVTPTFAAVTGRMQAAVVETGLVSAASLIGGGSAVVTMPVRTAAKTRTKQVGFQVLAGSTERMLPALLAGAGGTVPLLAAAAPQACYEVLAAWKDGDTPLAEEKQVRLVEAARLMEAELGVPGLKYGSDLNGYFGGLPRLPLLPLLGEQKAQIENLMQGLQS